jgi:hypothetical protein
MADDNTNAQAHQQPPEPSSALEHLNALVGEWTMEATVPSDPPLAVRGRATFEWLTGAPSLFRAGMSHTPTSPMASRSSARTRRPKHFASTTSTRAASFVCMR